MVLSLQRTCGYCTTACHLSRPHTLCRHVRPQDDWQLWNGAEGFSEWVHVRVYRNRCCTPPPHSALHCPHTVQSLNAQSTVHTSSTHSNWPSVHLLQCWHLKPFGLELSEFDSPFLAVFAVDYGLTGCNCLTITHSTLAFLWMHA
jgi:hypothetical protein